ncbi:MAG TPA: DUF4905 domain-containing protein [Ignavibacteriaceae bacterium]|nr:DUF4905 domain-containing protein [Ignavibacteriaceae bacterium]
MKIRKEYTYTNKRQIWRLIPSSSNLIVEDRHIADKEVFFNCIDIESGKKIFENLQFEEKFWVGIEDVYDNVIIFHLYARPDMPGHREMFAYDIKDQSKIWRNEEYQFLFFHNGRMYCYKELFEGRKYYMLDYRTGDPIEELYIDEKSVQLLKDKAMEDKDYSGYYFPDVYENDNPLIDGIVKTLKEKYVIAGRIEYAIINQALLLITFHEVLKDGSMNNIFKAIDLNKEKTIFDEVLDSKTNKYIPDAFFVKDNYLFLIKDKEKLIVCTIDLS